MSTKQIKLLIADDHRVLLDGLVMMLENVENLDVVATAANGEEVMLKMSSYYIDVLIMDIQMPVKDGYATAKAVIEKYPETKILVLSMHSEKIYIEKMYGIGVDGYLLKTAGKAEIVEAIEKVYQGGKYFSQDVTMAILNDKKPNASISTELTKRENEVLLMIANGFTNSQIAAKLFLSTDTIKTHRKNLMRKLDLNNTAGLVKYAVEHVKQHFS